MRLLTVAFAFTILLFSYLSASADAATTGFTIPPKSLKQKTKLKLEKVFNAVGGWVEFRQMMTDGKYLYACSAGATLTKFDIENEKHIKTVYVEGGIDMSLACAYSNGYLYTLGRAEDDNDLPAVLWRYNASDMTPQGFLDIPGEKVKAWQMIADDDYLYLPILNEPARVLRIKLNPFQHDLTITFATGENHASAIAFDDTREHIYVNLHQPAMLKKVNAATMEEVDSVALNYTQDNGYLHMENDGKYIYVAVSNGYASVVKVEMETMEVVAIAALGGKTMGNGVCVSDRGAGLVHCGNLEMGFSWFKIDATAGEDGEDMESMGLEIQFEKEPANRMKNAMIIHNKLWVANGRGKFLRFGGIVNGGPLAKIFNNKYSGEPKNTVVEEPDDDDDEEEMKKENNKEQTKKNTDL